jgi:hypothetical protein
MFVVQQWLLGAGLLGNLDLRMAWPLKNDQLVSGI